MAKQIAKYRVWHSSQKKGLDHTTRAMISLYDRANNLIGVLRFKMDLDDFPQDVVVGERIDCYYPPETYLEVIDLLRNEKPLYLDFQDEPGSNYGIITTRKEPVGEGEKLG